MRFLVVYLLLEALSVSALHPKIRNTRNPGSTKIVPSTPFSGNVNANSISQKGNLDGPQLSAVNTSSYEWWYFDAVSTDHLSSIVIVFYTALASGFGFITPTPYVTTVGISFSFPNGTGYSLHLSASEAIITTVGQGSSAVFKDAGAQWEGSPDLSSYKVQINAPASGVVGTFNLCSTAPAHYACGKAEAGQQMMVSPNIGWSNAIPDGDGEVSFKVHGEEFKFEGSAYHDHNWGVQPFQDDMVHEHWGRGRLGEYSLVWSRVVAPTGTEYATVYVSSKNKILTASCTTTSFSLTDVDSSNGTLTGYALNITLDSGKKLDVQVQIQQVVDNSAPYYMRWVGSLTGSVDGGSVINDGVAVFEEFDLSSLA